MSSFLGTLLNRHHGKLDVVQPKRLSRYESAQSESAPSDLSTMDNSSDSLQTERLDEYASHHHSTALDEQVDTHRTQPGSPLFATPLAHPLEVTSRAPHRDTGDRPQNNDRWQHRSDFSDVDEHVNQRFASTPPGSSKRVVEARTEPQFREFSTSEQPFLTQNDLDQRLSTTAASSDEALHRLRSEFTEFESLHQRDAIDKRNDRNDTFDDLTGHHEHAVTTPVVATIRSSKKTMSDESNHESGAGNNTNARDYSIEAPAWLATLEAKFQKRWQSLQAHTREETVVNVSIGRVEVRATRSDTPVAKTSRKKPTGVMSLDDYLAQRNASRGRQT